MNYRERMENASLSDEQKARISAAVKRETKTRRAEKERTKRRTVTAVSLSLALALIVAAPVGIFFGTQKNGVKEPPITNPGDADPGYPTPSDPSDPGGVVGPQDPEGPSVPGGDLDAPQLPDGISGKIKYKSRYAAGESIVATCHIIAGDTFTIEEVESGFAVSYQLLSSAPYARGAMTEYFYQVKFTASAEGEFFAGGLIFQTPKGYTETCMLYGYRPAEGAYSDGAVYASATSKDSAFSAYLYYLMEQGEITEEEYHDRLSEYWRQSGAVHEDLTVE